MVYCLLTTEGHCRVKLEGPRVLPAPNLKTDVGSFGFVPATYSIQLLAPSPSGSAVAAESEFETVPNQSKRHESGMPSFQLELLRLPTVIKPSCTVE